MRIEHIAMYVNDLERAREFFCKYFHGKSGARYHNPTKGFQSYFLSFDGGARLEIMTSTTMVQQMSDYKRTGYIHCAFSVGSAEAVVELTEKLKADGYEVISQPRTTGDGYYESCIVDMEGNQIEITA